MTKVALLLSDVVPNDYDELLDFWRRNSEQLYPHFTMPESWSEWEACQADPGMRWLVARVGPPLVAVAVLARISGPPWLSAEVGVGVDPNMRGRGIGTRTLRALFARELGAQLARIEALVEPGNTASQRMVAAAGMICEGLSRASVELDGVRSDMTRWAIVCADHLREPPPSTSP